MKITVRYDINLPEELVSKKRITPRSMEWNMSLWRFLEAVIHTLKNMNARAVMKKIQQTINIVYP